MNYIGIDIGSTASKVAILNQEGKLVHCFVQPTGWNSKITSAQIKESLMGMNIETDDAKIVATGYGRISVDYANQIVTEISCHGKGGGYLFGKDCCIIDVGGQDTKFIQLKNDRVVDFLMNDKCAAGTGKFIEVMANRFGVTIDELFELAQRGTAIPISSLCTVFAESEIINYMGEGKSIEDLAAGVVDSVAQKVATLVMKRPIQCEMILTGGLSDSAYFVNQLSRKLKQPVVMIENGRFAGAIGAALLAAKENK